MLDRLRRAANWFKPQSSGMSAASALPPAPAPKVSNKQTVLPSFLKTTKPNPKSALQRADRALANLDITTYRVGNDTRETVRNFRRASPDLSAAVTSYVRMGITSGFTAVAKNRDGTFNPEATSTLTQIITNMNVLNDYSMGFDDSLSTRALSEAWANELMCYGAMCGELVLNKARLPDKIQPISAVQVRKFPSADGKRMIPQQVIAGQQISLDIPTFFMVELDTDLLEPYPISPIESAIQGVLFSAQFMNDIRRIVRKAIHPRVIVTINEEKFRKTIPAEILNDQAKVNEFISSTVSDLATRVNGLEPEEALVIFDAIGVSIADHGNTNLSQEYEVLQGMADAKMAAGAKVLPTILGKGGGTSNTASAEVLIFLKYVEGTVWGKLNEMFSKMFTLAVRLLGHDVFVEFTYNAIDLKPESELEAFKAMKQSRYLMLLSLGLITDDECGIILTGHLPPDGYTLLAGTGFMPHSSVVPVGNGYNGATNNGSTLNQKTASNAPKGVKGQGNGKKAEVVDLTLVG